MDRHEFDSRYTEVPQVTDYMVRAQSSVSAANFFGKLREEFGKSLDVDLVDHRLVPGRMRPALVPPCKRAVHYRGQWGKGRIVALVHRQISIFAT